MRLWTWHSPNFSLINGSVDWNKSEYYQQDAGLRAAYLELRCRLSTDQLIWCYTNREDRLAHDDGRVEWTLDVPKESIIAFVDNYVWNRLLGKTRVTVSDHIRLKWKNEALSTYPHLPKKRHEFVEQKYVEFWSRPAPTEGWWQSLFVEPARIENLKVESLGVCALVRHPVDLTCLVQRPVLADKCSISNVR